VNLALAHVDLANAAFGYDFEYEAFRRLYADAMPALRECDRILKLLDAEVDENDEIVKLAKHDRDKRRLQMHSVKRAEIETMHFTVPYNFADMYREMGWPKKQLEYLGEARNYAHINEQHDNLSKAEFSTGNACLGQRDPTAALKWFNLDMKHCHKRVQAARRRREPVRALYINLGKSYEMMGRAYMDLQQLDKAKKYWNEAGKCFERERGGSADDLKRVNQRKRDLADAKKLLLKVANLERELQRETSPALQLGLACDIMHEASQGELYERVVAAGKIALHLTRQLGDKEKEAEVLVQLAEGYYFGKVDARTGVVLCEFYHTAVCHSLLRKLPLPISPLRRQL
jgi:tetratricopeptide (TPR) repeat protein